MAAQDSPKFAAVLSGGGARGAYEVGVLYYIRTQLPKEIAQAPLFSIYSGTSVGAINSVFLAATAHDPIYQGGQLRKVWAELSDAEIYFADVQALAGFLVKSGFFMATNFFKLSDMLQKRANRAVSPFRFKSVLDTTPFVYFLRRNIPWSQIHRNIERGLVDAVTVSATHIMSGQLALFVEKHPEVTYRSGLDVPIYCTLTPKHVLGSAALPLIFPIIRINRQFYGDGSLRQNTPMSPAIHLGANRLLVVSAHFDETKRPNPGTSKDAYEAEPTTGDVLGLLMDSLFSDRLQKDLEQMRRINSLIQDVENVYGMDAMKAVNARRKNKRENSFDVSYESRKITPLVITPSRDIGEIASDHFWRLLARRENLTPMQKFFAKVLENTPEGHNDLVSYLLFDREYLEALIQLGFEDARAQHEELIRFFSNRPIGARSSRRARKPS